MPSSILCGILFGIYLLLKDKAYSEKVRLSSLNSMVIENSSLELACQYQGNDIVTEFKWFRGSDITDTTVAMVTVQTDHCRPTSSQNITPCEFSCRNNHTNVWTIGKVTRDLIGFMYQCRVKTRNNSKDVSSNKIKPAVKIPVTSVSITKPKYHGVILMETNRKFDIQCETMGEFPGGEISWYEDPNTPYDPTDDTLILSSVDTTTEKISEHLERTVSVLTLCSNSYDTEMAIYCSANNIKDRDSVVSRQRLRFGMRSTKEEFADCSLILILSCSLGSLCAILFVYSVFTTVVMCKKRTHKNRTRSSVQNGRESLNVSNAYSNAALYDRPNIPNTMDGGRSQSHQDDGMYSTLSNLADGSSTARNAKHSKIYENVPKHMVTFKL